MEPAYWCFLLSREIIGGMIHQLEKKSQLYAEIGKSQYRISGFVKMDLRMRYFRAVGVLCLILVTLVAGGDNLDPRCQKSTEGTEFWFGFMEGRNTNNHYVEITVSSRVGATFQIFIGNSSTPYNNQSFTVPSNNAIQLRIPYNLVEPVGSEKVLPLGLHLVASDPVNVYCLNHDNNSSDVAVMYPVQSLGTEYFTMCYKPHVDEANLNHGRNSEFVVVASEDNTTVGILPSEEPDGPARKGDTLRVNLNRGDLYQVQSLYGDLSGSQITADKPVAVYGGSLSTTIPFTTPDGGWDHMYEQMPPVKTWGREYYTVPLAGRTKDYFRIMAAQNNTTIYFDNVRRVTIHKGEFYETTLSSPTRITADKPILVAQYSQSRSNDRVTHGDGFMLILSPVSQAKNDVTFVAYQSTLMRVYYVNIVVPVADIGNLLLDEVPLSAGYFRTYGNGKYASASIQLTQGTHRLRNFRSDRGFIAYVYGFGGNEAFGYGVGFNLNLVLDLSDGLQTSPNLSLDGDSIVICQGTHLLLDAGPYFDRYTWSTGKEDTLQDLSVGERGWYYVAASTVDGCRQKDSLFLELSDPRITIGNDTMGCPHARNLNVRWIKDQGRSPSYAWNTGATTSQIQVSTPGAYSVTATNQFYCPASDTMELSFYPVPEVKIDGEALICGEKSGKLTAQISGDDGAWSLKSWNWGVTPQAGVTFPGKKERSTDFTVSGWGPYQFTYTLTTDHECVVQDTLTTGIYQIPTSSFAFVDDPGDPCKGYSREVVYTGNASPAARLDWDFGNCAFELTRWDRARVSFAPFGSGQPFVSLQVSENGCQGEVTRLPFGAAPDFTMTTDRSQACDSDLVRFTGKLNVSDHLDFNWDFGDGATSTEQFPVHTYNQPGFYDVTLLITNPVTGCKAGFLLEEMVKIYKTPEARFEVDYPVALLEQANLKFTNQTLFGERYHWEFGDGGFSEEENPCHEYRQVGQYPVLLEAVSGMGCKDTVSMVVDILPFNVHAPNAFRPGSDIPENRTFMPFTLGVDPGRFRMQIYNRWGELIFESKSLDHPWDGTLRNSREAPMGNYIWRADYTDIQGFTHSRQGQVLLIR